MLTGCFKLSVYLLRLKSFKGDNFMLSNGSIHRLKIRVMVLNDVESVTNRSQENRNAVMDKRCHLNAAIDEFLFVTYNCWLRR